MENLIFLSLAQEIALKLGPDAHRKRDRRSLTQYNKFKQSVFLLDRDWHKVKVAYKERGGNPLRWLCRCFLGLLSLVLSICW